jgi:hypothetical protein
VLRKTLLVISTLILILFGLSLLPCCGTQDINVSKHENYRDLIGQEFIAKSPLFICLSRDSKNLWLVPEWELEHEINSKTYQSLRRLKAKEKIIVTKALSSKNIYKGEFIHLYGTFPVGEKQEEVYLGHILTGSIRAGEKHDRSFFKENTFVKPLNE